MGHLPRITTTKSSLLTELLGSFLFVLIGTSALTALNIAGQATTASAILVGTLAFAGTIAWLSYSFYHFPLPQFNPAVTILFWLQKLQPLSRSILVIVSQLLGAIAASVVVALLYGSAGVEVRLGAPYPTTLMGEWAAMVAEFIGTLLVLYAIQAAMNRQRLAFMNPFVLIGLGYGLGYLFSTGVSGGSLNPARALAPQLTAADLTGWWVYLIGPVAAAITVGLATRKHTSEQVVENVSAPTNPALEPQLPESNQEPAKPAQSQPQPVVVAESNVELQQKAQQAMSSLKESGSRPHLPFAAIKPSFFPLRGKQPTLKSEEPVHLMPTDTVAESLSPDPIPEADKSKPASSKKTEVKFINFEHNPLDENGE